MKNNTMSSAILAIFAFTAFTRISNNGLSTRIKRPAYRIAIYANEQFTKRMRQVEEKSSSFALQLARLSRLLRGKSQFRVRVDGPRFPLLLKYYGLKILRYSLHDSHQYPACPRWSGEVGSRRMISAIFVAECVKPSFCQDKFTVY